VLHLALGTPRIVLGKAVGHVLGDPELSPERERSFRRVLVEKALEAIRTPVTSPTLFSVGE
jgi:betaine reductase